MFKKLKLGQKLFLAFALVGLLPFLVIGMISLSNSSNALQDQSFHQLKSIRGAKKNQIENFFKERKRDMGVLMETVNTLRHESFNKLIALRDAKKFNVELYFNLLESQVKTFSENKMIIKAMGDFSATFSTFRSNNRINDSRLNGLKAKLAGYYHNEFSKEYKKHNNREPDTGVDFQII